MTVAIVPIAPRHVESFHRAFDQVARERVYLARFEAPPLEQTRAFVLDNIVNRHPQFVALADGEVVGWCDVRPEGHDVHAHCGVLGMGLLAAYRGRGIGWRLIDAVLAAAKARGFLRVELDVNAENTRAIALYRKAGFVLEGVKRNSVRIDGRFSDLHCMAVLFGEAAS